MSHQTTLFNHKKSAENGGHGATGLTTLIAGLRPSVNGKFGNGFVAADTSARMLGLESINDEASLSTLETEANALSASLESAVAKVATHLSSKGSELFSRLQKDAGVAMAMVGTNMKEYLKRPLQSNYQPKENETFITASGGDVMYDRMAPALEAFDEKENVNSVLYSVAYNMSASRQDQFAEAFFPTVIVTPDQVGFAVSIRIHNVMSDVRRSISGDLNKFNKRNLIQAVIDPSIFNADNTQIVPIYRTESQAYFVASSVIGTKTTTVGEETVTTAALAVGKKFSLIGISQTAATLATGQMDTTDAIDSAVTLKTVYVQMKNGSNVDVFAFNTARMPFAVWNRAPQGNYRALSLNFTAGKLSLTKASKTVANAEPIVMTDAVLGDYQLRLSLSVSGNLNQELGDCEVNGGVVSVSEIIGLDGKPLDLASGTATTIIAALGTMTVIGYDLSAQRVNSNRRQRGQLLDTTFYNQIYAVPLRSPLTILRPTNITDETDAADLGALITATQIRTSADAVKTLKEAAALLAEQVDPRNTFEQNPEILGVSRELVKATYKRKEIDLTQVIQSLTSLDRFENIQAAIVNILRDYVYNAIRDSQYQAAANALAGGVGATPTIIVGTDPVIARYLTVTGDTRLFPGYDHKIVTTLHKDMVGKLYISFGDFSTGKEGVPNPMHFGNMAWKPEATLILPILRNGAYTKELTVQPSYLHIVNLPILLDFDIKGITDVATGIVAVPVSGELGFTGDLVTHEGAPA